MVKKMLEDGLGKEIIKILLFKDEVWKELIIVFHHKRQRFK